MKSTLLYKIATSVIGHHSVPSPNSLLPTIEDTSDLEVLVYVICAWLLHPPSNAITFLLAVAG